MPRMLEKIEFLKQHGIRPPQIAELFDETLGKPLPLTADEAYPRLKNSIHQEKFEYLLKEDENRKKKYGEIVIEIKELKHSYPETGDVLSGVDLQIRKGEFLAIIGQNGSGKTTLLKLLNGIFWPDKGKISIKGKVGALIEVGAGFHPLLTGRENIYINAAILGMTKEETDKKFDAIVEFADIGDFIHQPIKNYSSGMKARLAFAVSVNIDPDILILDEVLSVGDAAFKEKSYEKIREFFDNGKTIFFVSHAMESIKALCNRAIVIDKGQLLFEGDPESVILKYEELFPRMKKNTNPQYKP